MTWIFSGPSGWGFLLSQHCTPNQWWFGPSSLEFDLDEEYPNTSWLTIFLLPMNNQSHMIAPKHLCVTPIIRVNFFGHLESDMVGVYKRTYTNHLADSLVEFWWYDYTLYQSMTMTSDHDKITKQTMTSNRNTVNLHVIRCQFWKAISCTSQISYKINSWSNGLSIPTPYITRHNRDRSFSFPGTSRVPGFSQLLKHQWTKHTVDGRNPANHRLGMYKTL